jgi:hypothetical protein
MKSVSIFAILISVVAGCALALMGQGSAQAQQGVCQTNPSPVDANDPSVIVTAPTSGATSASPLHVEGQARVFEATVSITLFDAAGAEIVSTTAMAAEGGVLSPFSADVTFSVTAETEACLWVFETSAQDGQPVNVVQVPLTLQAQAATTPTAQLPSTGAGGATGSANDAATVVVLLAVAGALVVGVGWLAWRRYS